MPLIAPPAVMPSKLALVNEALAKLKQPSVTTLVNAKPLIVGLGDSVDDCVNDIYSRANWRFRLRSLPIELSADQQYYSVPADFGNLYGRGITANNLFVPYLTKDEFDALTLTPYGTPDDPSGQPQAFTLWDFISFKFHPKPSADFVASYPFLNLQYLCSAQPIQDEDQAPALPYAFKLCVVNFLKYSWMVANEYGETDLKLAQSQYEGQLGLLLARNDPQPNGHSMRQGFRLGGRGGSSNGGFNKFNPMGG